jgi:S1-C subfamily serine protease
VNLTVQRDGDRRDIAVQLVPASGFFNAELIRDRLGLALEELTPAMERRFNMNASEAFYVSGVQENSPAGEAGLRAGMFITAIDGQMPKDLTTAAKVLYARRQGDRLRLDIAMVQRSGNFALLRPSAVDVTLR